MHAEVPRDLRDDVARLPLQYSFWWQGGAELDGLKVANWRYAKRNLLGPRWVEFEVRDSDTDAIRWLAVCGYGRQPKVLPAYYIVCSYEPVGLDPPLSLTLVANGAEPLSGAFLHGDRRFDLEGTTALTQMPPVIEAYTGTAGLRIDDEETTIGFVSVIPDTIQEAWLRPTVSVETRRAVAPLILAFGAVWDSRSANEEVGALRNETLKMPDPLPWGHVFEPHVDHFAANEDRVLQAALLQHLESRPPPRPAEPMPEFGPDLRAQNKAVSVDFSFVGISFAGGLSSDAVEPASDLGWSFGYPLILGASFFDFVHVQSGVEFGGVRPDLEPVTTELGFAAGTSSSEAHRVSVGGRVTLARLGVVRPFVGGEAVFQHHRSVLQLGPNELGTRAWGFGAAPVWGLRFTADAGAASMDLVVEGRVDVLGWQDPDRFGVDPSADPRFDDWLQQVEAHEQSVHLGGLVYLMIRL